MTTTSKKQQTIKPTTIKSTKPTTTANTTTTTSKKQETTKPTTTKTKETKPTPTTTTTTTTMAKNQCKTRLRGGGVRGVPCVFPFTYRGKKYTSCKKLGWRSWCATKTRNGKYIRGNWGFCNKDCYTKKEKPKPKGTKLIQQKTVTMYI